MAEIFSYLKTRQDISEFTELLWEGDALGHEFTEAELVGKGVSENVRRAYFEQRRFHNQVWRLLKAHRKAMGYNVERMEGLPGHVPHLFENWNVYETEENQETGELDTTTIVGTFRSLKEAVQYANTLSPDKNYIIRPKSFSMPDEILTKTSLRGRAYSLLIDKIESNLQLTRDEAAKIVSEIARPAGRHRFFGNLLKREGQEGYRKDDIAYILRQYYYSCGRYVALDDFKSRVVKKFERDFGVELGRANEAKRDRTVAIYIERYIRDVNGAPGELEMLIDEAIKRAFGAHVRSQRPTIWMVNKAIHFSATMKLGLFNLSAGIVNLTQLINSFSKLPAQHFSKAFIRVITGSMTARDRNVLRRMGITNDLGLMNVGGYSYISAGGRLTRATMYFFNKAEYLNRAVTALAAYNAAIEKNASMSEARMYARKMVDETQFDYSVADTARIFRNPAGRLLGQFKPFAIKQIEFITGLKGAEKAKFWIPYLLMAGTLGIPLIEGFISFIEWLTGTNILLEYKKFLMEWADDDSVKKFVARSAIYGLLGAGLGIDIAKRVGVGDALPRSIGDFLGPTINTILQMKESGETRSLSPVVKGIAPSVGRIMMGIEIIMNDMRVEDPYHRNRLQYIAKPAEIAATVAGFRPVRESELADIAIISSYEKRKYVTKERRYIDDAIEAIMKGKRDDLETTLLRAYDEGIPITGQQIAEEIERKLMPQELRTYVQQRKMLRGMQMNLLRYYHEEGE